MNGKKHRVWWDASGVSDRNMTSLYLAHILFLMGYLTAKAQESMTLSSSCCTLTTGSCRATCEENLWASWRTRVSESIIFGFQTEDA
ncbi:hypothetical protein CDAR_543141 [Caerostris darwini]|uniref:Uncharacterized protein n=1 Tax=Caerostris darwini TaxID=1538125 RepID=A0AAV4X6D2_9ARAC|nr:hypothetical protein CDAR_543141 [Caerostris darwini]